MKRFFFWLIGGLAVLLFCVLIGLSFYVHTEHFRSWAREQLVTALRSSVNGDVTLERLDGSLWRGLTFHNLSLTSAGREVIVIPTGTVTFDILPQIPSYLRSSTIRIGSLSLTAPVFYLSQDPRAGWNISTLFRTQEQPESAESAKASSQLSVFLERLSVSEGQITIQPAEGETTHVSALSLAGRVDVRPAGLQVDLGTLALAVARQGLPTVQLNGGMAYDTTQGLPALSLRQLNLRTDNSRMQISGTMQDLASPRLDVTAEIERLAIADLRVLAPTAPLQQDLSGRLQANGPLSALQVQATASMPDGQVMTQVTANVAQPTPHYAGTLAVTNLAIDKVLLVPDASGVVTGQVTFAVTGRDIEEGTFHIQGAQMMARGREVGAVTIGGTLEHKKAVVSIETQGQMGKTHGRGQLTLGSPLTYDATFSARNFAVTQVIKQSSLPPTTLAFDAVITGSGVSLDELDSTMKVTLLPSRVGDLPEAQGQFAGAVRHGRLTVDTLSLQARDTMLTAQGAIDVLRDTPGGNLTYSLDAKDLTPWLALFHQQGKGAITLRGNASGTLQALQLTGNAHLADLGLAKYSLQSGIVTYTLNGLGSPQAHGQATAVLTQMDAGIAWRTATLTLDLAGTQPLAIHTSFTGQDTRQQTQHIKAQLQYTPQSIQVLLKDINIQLPTGTWRMPQPASISMQQQTITIENLRLQRADSAVSAEGSVSFIGAQNLHLQVTRLPLADLRMLWAADPQVSGHVSATAEIQGSAAQPEIEANVTTSALTVTGSTYAGLTAQLTYRQPKLQLSAALRQDVTHTLSVNGGVPLLLSWAGSFSATAGGEGDFRVQSNGLNLAFLNVLMPSTEDVQGILGLDMQLRGPLNALVPTGQAWVKNGQVRAAKLGLVFTEVGAEAQLTPDAVRLSSLHVRSGEGLLTGNGRIGVQAYTVTAIDMRFNADKFQVLNTGQYVGTVSGQLSGSGSLEHPVLRGTLDLHGTTLRPDIALLRSGPPPPDPTITVVHSGPTLPTTSPTSGALSLSRPSAQSQPSNHPTATDTLFDRLEMDVAVTIPRNTWVQLDEGTIEFMGQVRARKNSNEPFVLIGSIETVRGWYSLYGRKFRVERGEIRFTGATPIDPSLDVVAQYTLPQYSVEVVVSGTARTPSVTLRSEPSLEQADIVSLLILGKPTNALNASEKTSLQSQALQTAAGYIASDLRRSLAQELGVENLELDVGSTLDQSRIGAGKYLSEDIFVSTSQQLGNKAGREFSIEYYLNQHWQIKATTTDRGDDGIDVLWQKRY